MTICQTCGQGQLQGCDSGFVEAEGKASACSNYGRLLRVNSMRRRWPMPSRFVGASVNDFQAERYDSIMPGIRLLESGLGSEKPIGSAVLCGDNSTGKTHLAAALVQAAWAKGLTAIFVTVTDVLETIRDGYGADLEPRESQVFNDLTLCSVLALDDLGKERPTEWAGETLWTALNIRYAHQRTTIVTTNLSDQQLGRDERYRAMAQRIAEGAIILKFAGASLRQPSAVYAMGGL